MKVPQLQVQPHVTRWSDVFRRSRMSPHIFVVARPYVDQIRACMHALHVTTWECIMMFGNAYWVTPLLDGLVQKLLAYGFGGVPSGLRVVGHRPLRLLCHLLEVVPPWRRLPGEPSIPTPEELVAELAAQRALPEAYLAAQAKLGMGTYDAATMRQMVAGLFGDDRAARARRPA